MKILQITDWNSIYENNRSREVRSINWVPIPNSQDGDGYTELMEHPNAAAHYGAWVAMVIVASKSSVRGVLRRDNGESHDARSLARMTRIPAAVFEEAIPRFLAIGWLSHIDPTSQQDAEYTQATPQHAATTPKVQEMPSPQEPATTPHPSPQEGAPRVRAGALAEGKGKKGIERTESERNTGSSVGSNSETPAARSSGLTKANANALVPPESPPRSPAAASPPPDFEALATKFPKAKGTVLARFPGADGMIVGQIIARAQQEYPNIADDDLAFVIRKVTKTDQRSIGLYLKTVPEFIQSEQARSRTVA